MISKAVDDLSVGFDREPMTHEGEITAKRGLSGRNHIDIHQVLSSLLRSRMKIHHLQLEQGINEMKKEKLRTFQ